MKIIYTTQLEYLKRASILNALNLSPEAIRHRPIKAFSFGHSVDEVTCVEDHRNADIILCDTSAHPADIRDLLEQPEDLALVIHKGDSHFDNLFGKLSRRHYNHKVAYVYEHSGSGTTFDLLAALAAAKEASSCTLLLQRYLEWFEDEAWLTFKQDLMKGQALKQGHDRYLTNKPAPLPYLWSKLFKQYPAIPALMRNLQQTSRNSKKGEALFSTIYNELFPN